MCLYNRLIKNKKYEANGKNGGIVPEVKDPRVLYVPVGCGECIECRKQKAREWQVRMQEDIRENTTGVFVTLTFSNESIQKLCTEDTLSKLKGYALDNALATRATRLFLERWRKPRKKSLRHWLITELGHDGTENVHLHGIVWTTESIEAIRDTWQYGFVWPRSERDRRKNYVNNRTVNYIIKYITKTDADHPNYKPKILCSKGIGGNYTSDPRAFRNKFKNEETIETYRTESGHKISMPIYWRNKIYTDEEREKLWLQRLDRQERWICGEKYKANDRETQRKLMEWYRQKNGELGYGKGKKDWNAAEYENAQRQMMIEKRIYDAMTKENKDGYPAWWDEDVLKKHK